jgi:3-dehydroquinate synthase
MTTIIEIKRENRNPGQVVVGDASGMLSGLLPPGRRIVAITDPNVDAVYGDTIRAHASDVIVIPGGEENKTFETIEFVHRRLIDLGADRRVYIVGWGGGIVTDVAGFAASTYLRGVEFGFVATSLLAQVDASVGGKNGVNVGGYKNMAGMFNQPDFVVCDTGVLATLPSRELRAGLAEMIKAGVIADPELFAVLEKHSPGELLAAPEVFGRAILAAIRVKADIVEADEREKYERRKLNLGHSVAHAVEKLTREFNHGEAVGIGLVAAAEMSRRLGLLKPAVADRIVRVVERAGLSTRSGLSSREIVEAMARDKKVEDGALWLVVVRDIGDVALRRTTFDETEGLIG